MFFILNSLSITAQINLVQNPSFEKLSSCQIIGNSIKLALGWDTLKNGGGGGPEVFNTCANPSIYFGVPINSYGLSYQVPKTGNSYSNMGFYVNPVFYNQREYIQNTLLKPLTIGKTYCVSFYVSLNSRSQYAIDELGAYFDKGTISTPPYGISLVVPQVKSSIGVYYSDTLNWMEVKGLYIATDAYTYLTLGNFRSNAATNKILIDSSMTEIAEYYIDDVSVIDVSTKADAGRDTLICAGDSVFIGRYNEIGLDCEWYNNNQLLANGSGLWVKPVTNQQYIVKQDICGYVSYDTINITIKPENCYDLENIDIPNVFTPNADGVNDTWHVTLKNATNVSYAIYNRWGNIIKESEIKTQTYAQWDGRTTAGEACNNGVYFYTLYYTNPKGESKKKKGYISLIP